MIVEAKTTIQTPLVKEIKKSLLDEGMTNRDLADLLGIHPKSLSRKFREPDTFKPSELTTIFRILHFNEAQVLKCMGVEI